MSRTLTLRNVPEPVLRALRMRARRNQRSMQKEILSILEEVAIDRAAMVEQLGALRTRLGAEMTLDELHQAIEEGRCKMRPSRIRTVGNAESLKRSD